MLSLSRVGEAYVNNTDLWLALVQATIKEMTAEMELFAQFWDQLLFTTGGPWPWTCASLWPSTGCLRMTNIDLELLQNWMFQFP